ncbi:MAG: amidohydrolase family protein [Pseudohongiellaceae bacterium]
MKRLFKFLGITLAVVAAAIAVIWSGLRPPAAPVASLQGGRIVNVTLIEPGIGRQPGVTVTIEDGRIASIEPAREGDSGNHVGGFVIPGLIDMHVHQPLSIGGFEEYFSLLYLMHGVTSVRDTGYSYPSVFARRTQIETGKYPGPRIFTCGTILDGDPPLWDNATVVATPDEAHPTVSQLASEGVDCIKVYTNLRPDVLEAIHQAAAEFGLPVIGHVPSQTSFEKARLSDVQHLIGIPDDAHVDDDNPMAAGWDALTDERIAFVSQVSLERDIAHTPTLVFLDYNSRRNKPDELFAISSAAYLPAVFPEFFWQPEESFRLGGTADAELYEKLRTGFERGLETVHEMHRRGVRIHAGTDTGNPFVVPGASLQRELLLLQKAGLTPEDALAAATTIPGVYLADNGLGGLRVGAPADMLVMERDPTESLAALDSITMVVADGRLYDTEQLAHDVDRYKDHFHNVVWERVVPLFARLFD